MACGGVRVLRPVLWVMICCGCICGCMASASIHADPCDAVTSRLHNGKDLIHIPSRGRLLFEPSVQAIVKVFPDSVSASSELENYYEVQRSFHSHPECRHVIPRLRHDCTASDLLVYQWAGISLEDLLDEHSHLSPCVCLEIAIEIARVVDCVHKAGWVHGNIGLATIALQADGDVLLTDTAQAEPSSKVGIAKDLDDTIETLSLLGGANSQLALGVATFLENSARTLVNHLRSLSPPSSCLIDEAHDLVAPPSPPSTGTPSLATISLPAGSMAYKGHVEKHCVGEQCTFSQPKGWYVALRAESAQLYGDLVRGDRSGARVVDRLQVLDPLDDLVVLNTPDQAEDLVEVIGTDLVSLAFAVYAHDRRLRDCSLGFSETWAVERTEGDWGYQPGDILIRSSSYSEREFHGRICDAGYGGYISHGFPRNLKSAKSLLCGRDWAKQHLGQFKPMLFHDEAFVCGQPRWKVVQSAIPVPMVSPRDMHVQQYRFFHKHAEHEEG